jgi:signal transduction histidine kinase
MAAAIPAPAPGRPGRLRLPRWTVRLRFTVLYGALFVVSGAGVIAITYWLLDRFLASLSPVKSLGISPLVSGSPATIFCSSPVPSSSTGCGTFSITLASPSSNPNGTVVVFNGGQPFGLAPKQVAAQAILQHNDDLHQLLVRSGIALAIVAVFAIGLGWLLAGRALRPLRSMATTAQQISEENLHRRLALVGPRDEVKDLGDTIDGLLGRLEAAFEAQRSFVANASHELRTPLTLARALIQMRLSDPAPTLESYRATCEEVLAAEDEQEQLIDSLLVLARSQHGTEQDEPFDLADVVAEVVEAAGRAAAERGVALESSLTPAPAWGEVALVHRLVSNLVDNALRYNRPRGGGRLLVEVSSRDGRAILTVANTGPEVPADEVERLLQPFQRLGAERAAGGDGLGLGLSIVAAVAKAHRAALEIHPGADGGLVVTVTFPARVSAGAGSGAATATGLGGPGGPVGDVCGLT